MSITRKIKICRPLHFGAGGDKDNPQDVEEAGKVVKPQGKQSGLFKKLRSPETEELEMSEEPEPPPESLTPTSSAESDNQEQIVEAPEEVTPSRPKRLRGSYPEFMENKVESGSVKENSADDPESVPQRRSGLFARRVINLADFEDED